MDKNFLAAVWDMTCGPAGTQICYCNLQRGDIHPLGTTPGLTTMAVLLEWMAGQSQAGEAVVLNGHLYTYFLQEAKC